MKNVVLVGLALSGIVAFSTVAQAQVVPYRVDGTFIGDLTTLEASGEGVGLHLGQMTFDVIYDADSGLTYDIQTAADGSQLLLVRDELIFTVTPVDGGLFLIEGVDVWIVVGGNGRFANVSSAGGPIISTFSTPEPVDLSDPTAVPAVFQKLGKLDLGKRGKKK